MAVDWEKTADSLWKDNGRVNLDQALFRKRIVVMSSFLCDADKSVMDLGAGVMYLKRLVRDDVRYYPVDLEKNCDETIVCNFNRKEFPDIKTDAAVLAGILEYIEDTEWFLTRTAEAAGKIILSYRSKEKGYDYSPLTTDDIINSLHEKGFILTGVSPVFTGEWFIGCFEKASPAALVNNTLCTGCGACANKCQNNAIEIKYDKNGFLKPVFNMNACSSCNQCIKACPVNPHNVNNANPDCYALWAEDTVRLASSSGGAWTLLADAMFKKSGLVFGAAWAADWTVNHIKINSINEIDRLRHSKYVQSNTLKTFREVQKLLERRIPVLYSGTPCQIAGLKKFLGKDEPLLITVDLLCFCSPPPALFVKYLRENVPLDDIHDIIMRDKERTGWSPYGYGYGYVLKSGQKVHLNAETDAFQKAFHSTLLRNAVCENCRFRFFPREGDITLGDAWGIDQEDASWNDGKGTSCVIINNEQGAAFFEQGAYKTAMRCGKIPLSWLRNKGNRFENDGRPNNPVARRFFSLANDRSFNEAVDISLHNKFDIALLGMGSRNYGNNLTMFAMYQSLEEMNKTVLMLDRPLSAIDKTLLPRFSLFQQIPYPEYNVGAIYNDKNAMKTLNDTCGIFLLPSDQLLRSFFVEAFDKYTLMDWVRSEKPKIAYAASFGVDYFEGDDSLRSEMGYFLSRFDAISLREESGVSLMKEQFGLDAECVLDPVFLCQKKYYDKMADAGILRLPEKPFLGGYILDPAPERSSLVTELTKSLGLEEYRVITDGHPSPDPNRPVWDLKILGDASVEEWLAVIKKSDFFITDSFHGICFAIIYRKQFAVIFNKWQWRGFTRIKNILKKLSLENRLADASDITLTRHILAQPIDYTKVSAILDKETDRSLQWLKNALDHCTKKVKNKTTYDILGEHFDRLEERLESETQSLKNQYKADLGLLEHRILSSRSYRIGRSITWLPRKLRGFFRCWKQNGLWFALKLLARKTRAFLGRCFR